MGHIDFEVVASSLDKQRSCAHYILSSISLENHWAATAMKWDCIVCQPNIILHLTYCTIVLLYVKIPHKTYIGRNVHVHYLWQKWLCNERTFSCKFQDIKVPSGKIIHTIINKSRQNRIRGTQIFQKPRTKLKILSVWRVTWSKFHIQDHSAKLVDTWAIWQLGFVQPWTGSLLCKKEFNQTTACSIMRSCTSSKIPYMPCKGDWIFKTISTNCHKI
jgi:hypothetical protein